MLDGPLSRARFGGTDYSHRSRGAGSPDGRYVFLTEPYFGGALRRIDLVEQEIKTIPMPPKTGIGGMTADNEGHLIILVAYSDRLAFLNAEGKIEKELKLDMQEQVGGATFPCYLNMDDVNGRIYASGYGSKKWYVWYWDLKDGSFHGVLPISQKDDPGKRKRNEAGPFKGTDLYNEMGSYFGPDDPKRNFLYVSPNDTMTFFRLDLSKEEIWACTREKDCVRFIGSGLPSGLGGSESWGSHLNAEGDIVFSVPHWNGAQLVRLRRIK